jgi:periplasmic divalent cation tolerance protein
MTRIVFVQTAVNNADEAERLSRLILESRLAACVSFSHPVVSAYRWKGKLERQEEVVMTIKTIAGNYRPLETLLCENHPYELPEIVCFAVEEGYPPYLQWLEENSGPQ